MIASSIGCHVVTIRGARVRRYAGRGQARSSRHAQHNLAMPMRHTAEHLAPDGIEDDIYASQRLLDSLCFIVHDALRAQHGEVLPIRGANDRDDVKAGLAGQLECVAPTLPAAPTMSAVWPRVA